MNRHAGVRVLLVAAQLAGLLLLVHLFQLENRTVFYVLAGASAGFIVHALLPVGQRLSFFALLSVAAAVVVLGWKPAAVLLGTGYLLIGVCNLAISFRARVGILLVVGGVLVVLRTATGLSGLPWIVGPVVGSMFMFRLALYLHSLRHQDAPHGLGWSTAYFFMVPNICFPLFPVVDYRTFVRSHFDSEHFRIYERGVRLMLRGILHLLAYRLVYYELEMDALYTNNLADVVRYVVATFMLYVRISGQFHLIVGVLCLFGFRLPATNNLYFLASSPTDFWRRINIYWKDFMMKLVYYPSFFRLRRHGNALAVAVSTIVVFAATWALHSYQSYWLTGGRILASRDIAFWGLFGAVALAATMWEIRPGRARMSKTDRSWTLARGVARVATFGLIATLWSLWNAHSLETWLFMWSQVRHATVASCVALIVLVVAATVLAGFGWGAPSLEAPDNDAEPLRSAIPRAALRLAVVGGLVLVGTAGTPNHIPDRLALTVEHLKGQGWSPGFVVLEQQGYYESLAQTNSPAAVPWSPTGRNESEWQVLFRPTHDFLLEEFRPSVSMSFLGAGLHTNRWGMRDRDYELAKPDSVWRVALFGPSFVMGWGVADSEVVDVLVERKLDSLTHAAGKRVEVLNFGKPGYSLVQQLVRLEKDGLRFHPDLILLTVHPYELSGLVRNLDQTMQMGFAIPDTGLKRIAARIGVGPGLKGDPTNLRLVEEDFDARAFRLAGELGARAGSRVAVLALRLAGQHGGNLSTIERAAVSAGVPWLDCSHIWDDKPVTPFRLSSRDPHPNAAGHQVIANCVTEEIERRAGDLRVPGVSR